MARTTKDWRDGLNADPLPWLLEPANPSVRFFALMDLLGHPSNARDVVAAKRSINSSSPVNAILSAMNLAGYWENPGPGYAPKYRATVWSLMFLDQLGANVNDARIQRACEYVLQHTQSPIGGFSARGGFRSERAPNNTAIHCLNGNLLRAFLDFDYARDERVQHSIEWQARSITGDGFTHYYKSGTNAPRFACAANGGKPCAWGAIKALRALARVPVKWQTAQVKKAVRIGTEFLLSRDPASADYSAAGGRISSSWFKLGFPSGYVADVLQNLETLVELGHATDPRLQNAVEWLRSKQNTQGQWKNQYAYAGKLWQTIEPQGSVSKWVTLRACRVLKAAS
jgi:hypothetical protein